MYTQRPKPLFLMPGLDGTGALFDRVLNLAPRGWQVQRFAYPADEILTPCQLVEWIVERLPNQAHVLVAESFSGPLALLVAQRCPHVHAVILCATFVKPPLPTVLARLPGRVLGYQPPPAVIAHFLTGGDVELARVVLDAVRGVSPQIIASRLVQVLTLDCSSALQSLKPPLLYLNATQDRLFPRRVARTIRQLKPTATFVDVQGPHLLLQCKPGVCWFHMMTFLERLP